MDAHGCPACPHPAVGPAIQGSPDVNVNRRPALRVDDPGIHTACCGANTWTATAGSLTVFINGKGAHRMGDQNRHCGGMGQLVEGSTNVIVGEASGGGAPALGPPHTPTSAGSASSSPRASSGGAASIRSAPSSSVAAMGNAMSSGGAAAAGSAASRNSEVSSDGEASDRGTASSAAAVTPASGPAGAPDGPVAPDGPDEPPAGPNPDDHWIEIALIGEDGHGVPGERYVAIMPDGARRGGRLDGDGRAKLYGPQAGMCEVSFPGLDSDAWEAVRG